MVPFWGLVKMFFFDRMFIDVHVLSANHHQMGI